MSDEAKFHTFTKVDWRAQAAWYGRLDVRVQPAVRALEARKADLEAEIAAAKAELDRIIDALDQLALTEEEPHGQAATTEAPGPPGAGGVQQGPDQDVQGAGLEQGPAAQPEARLPEPQEVGPGPC